MGPGNKKNSSTTNNPTLRLLGASMALAGLAYGSYKYLTSSEPVNSNQLGPIESTKEALSSNRLRFKQKLDTSVSFVITKSVLEQIDEYNDKNEDGIDFVSYLTAYPNLVLILYPGLGIEDLETYFEINQDMKYRIMTVQFEESIFHILKHLNSELNLVRFKDFQSDEDTINQRFRLGDVLNNLISLDDALFIDYI